jgi:hypothetical protein
LILSGWNLGFNKIGLTKLLQTDLGYSLSHAKAITDAVLGDQPVTIDLKDIQVDQMVIKLNKLRVKFVLNNDAGTAVTEE